jgi:hypothetical protein
LAVYTQGTETWIQGALYKNNPLAQIIIELLRRQSDKIRASVGGRNPQVIEAPDGKKQTVVILSWDDVALTLTTRPVNNFLKPVRGIKETAVLRV